VSSGNATADGPDATARGQDGAGAETAGPDAAAGGKTLVALDIDGTLLDWRGRIPRSAARAVARVLAAPGLELVLATGRSVYSAMGIAGRIGLDSGWAVCSNGSVTVRLDPALPQGWEAVDCVTFNPADAIAAIRRFCPTARLAAEEIGCGFVVTERFPEGELDGAVTVVTDEEMALRQVTRLVLRATDLEADAADALVEQVRLPGVTYAVGWTGWIDLNPPGVSKASALEAVRERLGVHPGRTVAIGDGGNDISMLRWAARGVAMGDARDAVKAAADEVTGTIDQRGLARVLETLV
jgi:hydroxymethylpyrimidine pyrophosphatase-like HAD family hydrolase